MPLSENIIQRPELLLQLREALGLRQAHVAPTLNEGIQAVVVVADIGRDDRPPGSKVIGLSVATATPAATFMAYQLQVPATADRVVRLKSFRFFQSFPNQIAYVPVRAGIVRNAVWEPFHPAPGRFESGTAINADTTVERPVEGLPTFGLPTGRLFAARDVAQIDLAGEPEIARYDRVGPGSTLPGLIRDDREIVLAPGFSLILTGMDAFNVGVVDGGGLNIMWEWEEGQLDR